MIRRGTRALFAFVLLAAFVGLAPAASAGTPKCFGKTPTIVNGNAGATVNGTSGNDVIFAGGGNDTVNAGGGNDLVCGGNDDDTLNGGPGNDKLDGDDGVDVLNGDANNDTLIGGPGDDEAAGGDGTKDKVSFADLPVGFDFFELDTGGPVWWVGTTSTPTTDVTHTDVERFTLTPFRDLADFQAATFDGIMVDAGGGHDVVQSPITADSEIRLGEGDDQFGAAGPAGTTLVKAGPGGDIIDLNNPGITAFGDDGMDILFMSGEAVIGHGGDGRDLAIQNGVDSQFFGEDGSDQIRIQIDAMAVGGKGSDRVEVTAGKAANLELGPGADTARFTGGAYGIIDGGGGPDDLISDVEGNGTWIGGPGDDYIVAHDGSATITGGTGEDTIHAGRAPGDGDEAAGDDTVDGGDGDDQIFDGSGANTLNGGAGNDLVIGGSGIDTIHGNAGDDRVWGDDSSDAVHGDGGNDTVGGDEFLFMSGGDNDTCFTGERYLGCETMS